LAQGIWPKAWPVLTAASANKALAPPSASANTGMARMLRAALLSAAAALLLERGESSLLDEIGCDWKCYLSRYPELWNSFSNTEKLGSRVFGLARKHWRSHGRWEGKDCSCSEHGSSTHEHWWQKHARDMQGKANKAWDKAQGKAHKAWDEAQGKAQKEWGKMKGKAQKAAERWEKWHTTPHWKQDQMEKTQDENHALVLAKKALESENHALEAEKRALEQNARALELKVKEERKSAAMQTKLQKEKDEVVAEERRKDAMQLSKLEKASEEAKRKLQDQVELLSTKLQAEKDAKAGNQNAWVHELTSALETCQDARADLESNLATQSSLSHRHAEQKEAAETSRTLCERAKDGLDASLKTEQLKSFRLETTLNQALNRTLEEQTARASALKTGKELPHGLVAGLLVILVSSTWLCFRGFFEKKSSALDLHTARLEVARLEASLQEKIGEVARLEQELEVEVGDMMRVGDGVGDLGSEFGFRVWPERSGQETVRFIKIQCPGVSHGDITVNIIFNGCVVRISRAASPGVEAVVWSRRFQFRPSEGLFEFREDQMELDQGFLKLTFRVLPDHHRVVRFPEHFSLAATDADLTWDFPEESATGDATERSLAGESAPGRLLMAGVASSWPDAVAEAAVPPSHRTGASAPAALGSEADRPAVAEEVAAAAAAEDEIAEEADAGESSSSTSSTSDSYIITDSVGDWLGADRESAAAAEDDSAVEQ